MDIYKTKVLKLEAEKLDCDVMITLQNGTKSHVQGGNYLIHMEDGRIYPAKKELFEYLFEKEETNE